MKKSFLLVALAVVMSIGMASAQQFEAPKEGVDLKVENTKIAFKKGQQYEFDIYLVRSNKAKRAKFELPQFSGPKGLLFEVKADEATADVFNVTVNAANVEAGKYFYILRANGKGSAKAKGTTMSFEILDATNSVATTN